MNKYDRKHNLIGEEGPLLTILKYAWYTLAGMSLFITVAAMVIMAYGINPLKY
jgi:hypothetical protein